MFNVNKHAIEILIILLFFTSPASLAATNADYAISSEVIDLGGASMGSTSHKLFGKLREVAPKAMTNSSHTLESRFLGIVYGTGAAATAETPVVKAIKPATGYNYTSYRVIINGWNISSDATARLTGPSLTDIDGTTVTIESSTSMECTFDLTGAVTGARNVAVINTGYGKIGTLAKGFAVLSHNRVEVIGTPFNEPNPFNPYNGPTMIKYTLNTSATITLYLFNQRGAIAWQKTIPAGENGGAAGENSVPWNAISDFNQELPSGVYLLSIVSGSGGSARELDRIKIVILRQ